MIPARRPESPAPPQRHEPVRGTVLPGTYPVVWPVADARPACATPWCPERVARRGDHCVAHALDHAQPSDANAAAKLVVAGYRQAGGLWLDPVTRERVTEAHALSRLHKDARRGDVDAVRAVGGRR